MVQWLAGNGGSVTQPDNDGVTPLRIAAQKGHLEVVRWLAGNGGSIVRPGNTVDGAAPLWTAARQGRLEVVQWLAGNGGSATQPDSNGASPLFVAAYNGHLEVVQWLAGNGGSVTQPASDGYTPLLIAAESGCLEVVRWLAGNGGSVTQPDNDGASPLLIAARQGHLEVVQWLAGNGGSITQPANDGSTAVASASANGHGGIAAFLTAASSWSTFKIMVACRMADDAKRALCNGQLDPGAGPTSLAELVATSVSTRDALWAGSPDVCPAMSRLVYDAMGPWTPSRHFLFHARVRTHIRVVLLSGNRVRDRHDVPTELWQLICSFFRRPDWEVPARCALAVPGTGCL